MLESKGTPPTEYQIKEFEALRGELDETVKATWELERYALLVTGGIWAWSIPQSGIGFALVRWLPLGLNLLFGLRALALYRHINRVSDYLLIVEGRFFTDETEGWERHFRKHTDRFTVSTAYLFWGGLLLGSVFTPFLLR